MPSPVLRRAHASLRTPFNVWDLAALALILGLFIALSHGARETFAPIKTLAQTPISLDPWRLPEYAVRTSLRMIAAMVASLVFTFGYATLAAKSRHAEMVLIPLLDILQSVPVLGFLSFTLTVLMALFPGNVLGVEFASIFAVFTAQAWNMTFSFYQSLSTLPGDLDEAARAFGLSPWQKFWRLEAALRRAGADLEHDDVHVRRLVLRHRFGGHHRRQYRPSPCRASAPISPRPTTSRTSRAVGWAILAMGVTILLFDQLLFRPLVAWAEKFRFELTASADPPRSWLLDVLRRARLMARIGGRPGSGRQVAGLGAGDHRPAPPAVLSGSAQRTFDRAFGSRSCCCWWAFAPAGRSSVRGPRAGVERSGPRGRLGSSPSSAWWC